MPETPQPPPPLIWALMGAIGNDMYKYMAIGQPRYIDDISWCPTYLHIYLRDVLLVQLTRIQVASTKGEMVVEGVGTKAKQLFRFGVLVVFPFEFFLVFKLPSSVFLESLLWLVLIEGIVVGIVLAVLIGGGRFAELESAVLIGRGIVVKIVWAVLIGGGSFFVETGPAVLIGGRIVIKVELALLIGEGIIIELGIPVACRGGVTAVQKAAQK
jgi:hypothetical protein